MKSDTKDQEALVRPEPKPPIYPVSVIEVACRALDSAINMCRGPHGLSSNQAALDHVSAIGECALRIIRDGLASHEKAIRSES